MVEPGRLAWGLRRACLDAGVRIYEHTPVDRRCRRDAAGAGDDGCGRPYGSVRAGRVALAAGVPGGSLLRRISAYVVPVWDYVLMTEPLSAAQLDSSAGGTGAARPTWATSSTTSASPATTACCGAATTPCTTTAAGSARSTRRGPATFATLAAQFFATFPQLEGVSFTHAWGGVIDTCSRFCAFFGTAHAGRVAYAAGYTGLGVGATRFAAQVLLDKLYQPGDPNGCGFLWSTPSRCPSRRSRCARV